MNYPNNYEKTGLLYVDMVASCVSYNRMHNVPLKTIYLGPKAYSQFEDFVRFNLEREGKHEEANGEFESLTFDSVEVKLNSSLMGEKMYFDYYPVKAEA